MSFDYENVYVCACGHCASSYRLGREHEKYCPQCQCQDVDEEEEEEEDEEGENGYVLEE